MKFIAQIGILSIIILTIQGCTLEDHPPKPPCSCATDSVRYMTDKGTYESTQIGLNNIKNRINDKLNLYNILRNNHRETILNFMSNPSNSNIERMNLYNNLFSNARVELAADLGTYIGYLSTKNTAQETMHSSLETWNACLRACQNLNCQSERRGKEEIEHNIVEINTKIGDVTYLKDLYEGIRDNLTSDIAALIAKYNSVCPSQLTPLACVLANSEISVFVNYRDAVISALSTFIMRLNELNNQKTEAESQLDIKTNELNQCTKP